MEPRRRRSSLLTSAADRETEESRGPSSPRREAVDHVESLLKAKIDLEKAMTECAAALGEVRRALRGRGVRPSTIH